MTLASCLADLDAKLRLAGATVPADRAALARKLVVLADKVNTLPDRVVIDASENGVVLYWSGGDVTPGGGRTRVGSLSIANGGVAAYMQRHGEMGDFFDAAGWTVEVALARVLVFVRGEEMA